MKPINKKLVSRRREVTQDVNLKLAYPGDYHLYFLDKLPLLSDINFTAIRSFIDNRAKDKRIKIMAFKKSGVVPIEKVMCQCGGTIDPKTNVCSKCKKEFKKK